MRALIEWLGGIAWQAVLKRLIPYALAAVVAAWAFTVWWAYDQGREQGRAAQEQAWAASYALAVRRWHTSNIALADLNATAAREIEAARQNKRTVVREVIRYVERARQQPELAACIFDDSFMRLRRAQLARTRSAGPD